MTLPFAVSAVVGVSAPWLHAVREWRDHVQAGVCPTSRRGHTATLVLGRRTVDTACPGHHGSSENVVGAGSGASAGVGLDPNDGSEARSQTMGGETESRNVGVSNGGHSPRPPGKAASDQHALQQQQQQQQGLEGRRSPPGKGGRIGGGGGGRRGDGIGTGKGGESSGQRESREMFVIGGAGTDPIRVRASSLVPFFALSFPVSLFLYLVAGGKAGPPRPRSLGPGRQRVRFEEATSTVR